MTSKKRCKSCNQFLDLEEFHKFGLGESRRAHCRKCVSYKDGHIPHKSRRNATLKEKFLANVDDESALIKPATCLEWRGLCNRGGYGVIQFKNKKIRAHRLSYLLFCGPIPQGMFVCHRCDNPKCVQPKHLFLGTKQDNTDDMVQKNRQACKEKHGNAKLKIKNIQEIAALRLAGWTLQQIANYYDVSLGAIKGILSGRNWGGLGCMTLTQMCGEANANLRKL